MLGVITTRSSRSSTNTLPNDMASARLPGLKRHIGGMLKVCPIALNMNTVY